jgi:hypothetical protein
MRRPSSYCCRSLKRSSDDSRESTWPKSAGGHTLQTTALVNEAFVRLVDAKGLRWQDPSHFLGISARLMRRVLVDHARARGYQ